VSANIYWTPLGDKRHDISPMAPSSFIEAMERAFGKLPIILELNEEVIATLRGMAAAEGSATARDEYRAVRRALEDHRKIRLWAEY